MPPVVAHQWRPGQRYGSPIYLDAGVLIYWLHQTDPRSARAQAFIADQLVRQNKLLASVPAIDETLYRLGTIWVASSVGVSLSKFNLGSYLKRHPGALLPHHSKFVQVVTHLRAWATLVHGEGVTTGQVVDAWMDRLKRIDGVRDALHLALAEHEGAKTLATTDRDYARIKQLPFPLEIVLL